MESELTQLINYRIFSATVILIGIIISAVGGFYFRKYNGLIAKERHELIVKNQSKLDNNIKNSKNDILYEFDKGKLETDSIIMSSKDEIIQNSKENTEVIINNQNKKFNTLEASLPKEREWIPLVSGIIKKGVTKAGTPKSFKSNGIPDRSEKRKSSWMEFKTKNNLEHHIIPFKISNYGKFPISEVNLRINYEKPVIYIGEGRNNVPIPEVRNFPGIFDITKLDSTDLIFQPFEWITNLLSFENFHVSELGPNESLEFQIKRITDRNFLRNPEIELKFTDHTGQKWVKIKNDYTKIESK